MIKNILGGIAMLLTFYAFLPYIRSVTSGRNRPHVFSWLIWGLSTFIVFFAQLADQGGAGAWPIGVSGIISLFIALWAYLKRADRSIRPTDWVFLFLALVSLPLWYLTSNPVGAVILLTTIDTLGFGPTFTKSYLRPFEEPLYFYVLISIRNLLSIGALEHYSVTTVLFPAVMTVMCILFIGMVWGRRKTKKPLD